MNIKSPHRFTPFQGIFRRFLVVVIVAVGSLGMATGCASDKQVIAQAQNMHSGLEEAVITDPQLAGYLQQVGDRIISSAQDLSRQGYGESKKDREWMFDAKSMQFHFVNSDTLNAFTTGGNHMYIYTKLFQTAKSEDELAAVMAHEFAHIYGRHVQGGMNRQYAIIAAAAAAGAGGYALGGSEKGGEYAGYGAGLGLLAGQFVGMGFTRKDETSADEMGFQFYVRAGWDPEKFDDFFQAMIDSGLDQGNEMLSDHPSMSNRVAAIKKWVSELPPDAKNWRKPPVANAKTVKQLQARSVAVGKNMPSDKSLENTKELLAALPRSCLTPVIQEDQKTAEEKVMLKAQASQQQQGQSQTR
ncbi:MAG: M48 family metalloprotease [Chthoniobacterales bacterium]|nr:M48 family metalloprotease [Chthoniobacterales bacterium]